MTFDAAPTQFSSRPADPTPCQGISVCDLSGTERFLVWAVRWEASLHEDPDFARDCLRESLERAGLGHLHPVLRTYVEAVHGAPLPYSPATRLGCWRVNAIEAATLRAVACLQAGTFGEAWNTLAGFCARSDAARAMLALGEIAEGLMCVGGRIRPWRDVAGNVQP